MALPHAALAMLSLLVVLALILGAGRLARRGLAPHLLPDPRARLRRLGTLPIDARRRVHLVEIDGRRAVLLTGGGADQILPWPAEEATRNVLS